MLEICFHGRGGQGTVTAAALLAAAALRDGNKGVQSFPLFGAERRGAPVKAFARISAREVNLRSQIYYPDVVVVLDPNLTKIVNITQGLKKGGALVINTPKKPTDFDFSKKFKVVTVDATSIAIKFDILVGGIPIVNTPILGAMPRVLEVVSLDSIRYVIKERWKGELGEKNAQAAKEVYELTGANFR